MKDFKDLKNLKLLLKLFLTDNVRVTDGMINTYFKTLLALTIGGTLVAIGPETIKDLIKTHR